MRGRKQPHPSRLRGRGVEVSKTLFYTTGNSKAKRAAGAYPGCLGNRRNGADAQGQLLCDRHEPGVESKHVENTWKSRYVWLPIEWDGDKPVLRWRNEWCVEEFN